jgi:hypothetical protein
MQVAETSFEVVHIGLGWVRRQTARVMAGLIAPVLATLTSATTQTSFPATPEAFGQALKAWAAEHRIKRAFTSFAAYAKRLSDGTARFVHAEPRVEEGRPAKTSIAC